jgi:single-stranded-DNA-specific exonuclease
MTDALDQCRALLIKHGGHAAAAGFTLRSADVNTLAEKLKGIAEAALGEMDLRPTQRVDVDAVPLRDLNRDLVECLRQFEPCGFDNPTPVLASRGVKVASSRTVGSDGKHLKLTLSDGRSTFDAIAFGQAPNHPQVPAYVDVAYCLELNDWNGEQRLQLNVKNLKQAGQD